MIPITMLGALSGFRKHWGKIVAGLFVVAWIWATLGLYNDNKELSTELGKSTSAVEICIADRVNMDNVLVLLKADIASIQADNEAYKESIAVASNKIEHLATTINESIILIDQEVIPESCEGTMDWMLNKALAR